MPARTIPVFLLSLALLLTACGGGSSGGKVTAGTNPLPEPDTTADQFTFKDITLAGSGNRYLQGVTVSGLSDGVTVQATLVASTTPEVVLYLNGLEFQNKVDPNAAHEVQNGDIIRVGVMAADQISTTVGVTLRLAGTDSDVSDRFDVTTRPEFDVPDLVVDFPPANALTNSPVGQVVRFRGRASDETELREVFVRRADAPNWADIRWADVAEDGSWSIDLPLADGENEFGIVARDASFNSTRHVHRIVRADDIEPLTLGESHIVAETPADLLNIQSLALVDRDRLLAAQVPIGMIDVVKQITEIDLSTGDRRVFSAKDIDVGGGDPHSPDYTAAETRTDADSGRTEVIGVSNQNDLVAIDIETGDRRALTTTMNTGTNVRDVLYDPVTDIVYALSWSKIVEFAFATNSVRTVTDDADNNPPALPDGDPGIAFGSTAGKLRAYMGNKLVSIDLQSGMRTPEADILRSDGSGAWLGGPGANRAGTAVVYANDNSDLNRFVRFDPDMRELQPISDMKEESLGPTFSNGSHRVAVDHDRRVAYYSRVGRNYILAIDMDTGVRMIVSKSE